MQSDKEKRTHKNYSNPILSELLNKATLEELDGGVLYCVKLKIVAHRLKENTPDCWILLDTTKPEAKRYKELAVHYKGVNIRFFDCNTVDVLERVSSFVRLQSERLNYEI